MGQVIASASMWLDGYVAKRDNTIGSLLDRLQNGKVDSARSMTASRVSAWSWALSTQSPSTWCL